MCVHEESVMCTILGRGTATSEGVAIAQATMEYIHNNIGMCKFAAFDWSHTQGLVPFIVQ